MNLALIVVPRARLSAIEAAIVEGPRTPDMGGKAGTAEVGAAVAEAVRTASGKGA